MTSPKDPATPTLFEEAAPDKAKASPSKPKAAKDGASAKEGESEGEGAGGKEPGGKDPSRRSSAEEMATRQREISVAEFFTKNRHLLGFDSPLKGLLTAVKEAVDNSLDACEEAGILPEILVELHPISEERFRIVVEDNGPGIVKDQIGKVFGKLLYGSKF
ncbi:MAG: ATP-binding protein, partial [Planctomycetia bacterium]